MKFTNTLNFGFSKKMPMLLQAEAAECGMACLGMIASYYGQNNDIITLRQKLPPSIKGVNLNQLVNMACKLDLRARALKLEIDDLKSLKLPCILHWNFNHFVVLKKIQKKEFVIHDPARGIRTLSLSEVSDSFTGVALEIWPSSDFQKTAPSPSVKISKLISNVRGLGSSLILVTILALSIEICSILSPFYMQTVLDKVLVSADTDLLTVLAIGFGLLLIIQHSLSLARSWSIMYVSTMLGVQWQINVFSHLLSLPLEFFQKRHLGDIVSRFGSLKTIQQTLTTSFIEAVLDGIMTCATFTLMVFYSSKLAVTALIAMFVYGLFRWAWYKPLRNANENLLYHSARQQTHFLESARGVRTIKLFNRIEQRTNDWSSLLIDELNAGLHPQKLQIFYSFFSSLLFGSVAIYIIWMGAKLVLDGHFSAGMLIAFSSYKDQFNLRVAGLIDKVIDVIMLRLHGERLADIVLQEAEQTNDNHFTPDNLYKNIPTIEMRNVCFRFSEYENYILDDISITIKAGESVAITGPSGGGKSTLINILLGILTPSKGEILFDGNTISPEQINFLRDKIGTVLQDDVLFAGSIVENISFFESTPDIEMIERCSKLAAVHEDIVQMPMGYNTLVGDMGTVLSGGQKQRVLLARALYKQPLILFLDEATSHLDVMREASVNESLQNLNITRVIVAHRPDTIKTADRVIEINRGRISFDSQVATSNDK
ncbi:peptidase domain-containing ABC transporter [Pantoea ananatis]|uniref:peptidase domain-containing ABC transporter n=1 Tax=Pantoea ananas TaxID=553 RepID=UPI0021AC26C6|nr:peptidase domain-containing ABC transporter [Pantoea ananatis]